MPEIVVRPTAPELTRPLRQAILRPHQSVEEVAGHEAPGVFAVGAFDGEELIAVGLVAPDGDPGGWRVRGMATAPHARGRGAGAAVLDALVTHALAGGGRRIWCNARVAARSLYARAGFAVISEEFELPDIGPHVVMEIRTTRAARQHHQLGARDPSTSTARSKSGPACAIGDLRAHPGARPAHVPEKRVRRPRPDHRGVGLESRLLLARRTQEYYAAFRP